MTRRRFPLLAACALAAVSLAVFSAAGAGGEDPAVDEDLLEEAGFATDGPALVRFFRQRCLPDSDRQALLERLVSQLGAKTSRQRKQAAAELVGHGAAAVEVLKVAAEGSDRAVRDRAQACLNRIEKGISQSIVAAAARVLARRRPPGGAAALFAYLPQAGDEWLRDELLKSLADLAVRRGKPDPVLVKGLADNDSAKRSAAAYLLGRMGGPGQRQAVRRLLDDPDPAVRRRAAQGLVGAANLADQASKADEALLKANHVGTDDAGLAAYLRKRSLTPRDRQHLRDLVRQLASRRYLQRKQAMEELVRAGTPALQYLKSALQDDDVEVVKRAALCVARIERGPGTAVPAAAVRALVKLDADDAVKVLLGYVPSADDEYVERTVLAGLCKLAVRDVKLDPAFAAALQDAEPARRAAAAYVLGRAGLAEDCRAVRGLLGDRDPKVRLAAAHGLLYAQEKDAAATLVKLLDLGVDKPVRARAEELLRRLAGDRAPDASVAEGPSAQRATALAAWRAWWRRQGDDLVLARPSWGAGERGLTLVCEFDGSLRARGQVWEFGRDRQPRWKIDDLQAPTDAQAVAGDKVLVVEAAMDAMRVSERDLKGKIVWEVKIDSAPIACQYLDGGNIFLATATSLMEVTAGHDEVYNHNRETDGRIMSARKAPNGHIVYITDRGRVVEFDPRGDGREVYRFSVGDPGGPCSVEWLPNGRYLVALSGPGKVMEVDRSGRPLWQVTVPGVSQALRLPSGNLLVACRAARKLKEVNRAGKVLWEQTTRGRPWRIHRQ
jgi:HEAT repeat protein